MYRPRPGSNTNIGSGSRIISCAPIITRFPANSLTTNSFRWLHSEAWNDSDLEFFVRERQTSPSRLLASVPYVNARHRVPPVMQARWVLEEPPGTIRAWVEIQAYFTSFTTYHALISPYFSTASTTESWENHQAVLSFMVSGILIMSEADLLMLLPNSPAVGAELKALGTLGWGESKSYWSPYRELHTLAHPAAPVGELTSVTMIDPIAWWETPWGEADQKTLAYLQKRVEAARVGSQPPRRRRRSLLSRLLRWS